jgi:N-acetylglucosaminyldiphosphoundecaprenol N-acetyl-beta-D-mannosaminyltransferase
MLDPKLHKYETTSLLPFSRVAFADLNFFTQSLSNERFNNSLDVFEKIYCDGYWLFKLLSLLGYNVEYLTGPRFFNEFLKETKNVTILSKYNFSDLGLQNNLNNIRLISVPFVQDVNDFDYNMIVNQIQNDTHLFVSLGCPKQEIFISNLSNLLNNKLKIYAVGAAVDFYFGKEVRAPKFLQKLHLEFLWRLIISHTKQIKKWILIPKTLLWFTKKLMKQTFT